MTREFATIIVLAAAIIAWVFLHPYFR